jgi:hypothetical protein
LEPLAIVYASVTTFVCLSTTFSGIKPMYDLAYAFLAEKRIRREHLLIVNSSELMPKTLPIAAIVVPVFNDFMPRETLQSFKQTYKGVVKYYILDDSTDENQKKLISEFAKKHKITILRQTKENRAKFGKGNGLAAAFNYFVQQTKGE